MFPAGRVWLGIVFVTLHLAVLAPVARAEFYFAGYLGASFTQSSDVEISDNTTRFFTFGTFSTQVSPFSLTLKDVGRETSLMGGGKLGYWFDGFPNLGIEADGYHFSPDSERNNVPITGNIAGVPVPAGTTVSLGANRASIAVLGFHLVGRLRFLQSSELPNGRLQPYLGVGPAIFFADVSTFGAAHRDTTVGVQALAGLKVFLSRRVSLFGEYKFSHVSPELDFFPTITSPTKSTKVTVDLNSHHLYGGVALHFDLF